MSTLSLGQRPLAHVPLNLDTRTDLGLCTNTASGNTLPRY